MSFYHLCCMHGVLRLQTEYKILLIVRMTDNSKLRKTVHL
jgi:hypothetical protein